MKAHTRLLAALAACAILLPSLSAQDPSPLTITVTSGEGTIYRNGQRASTALRVRVQGANGQPVPKALVLFSAPDNGAGGIFLDGLKRLQVTTGVDGIATGNGFDPNTVAGPFQIAVTALAGSQTAYTVIHQTNAPRSAGLSRKRWWIAGGILVLAGAAGGSYAALRHGSTNSTSIGSGGVTVGAPH